MKIFGLLFAILIFLLIISTVLSFCEFRESCLANQTCLFSIAKLNNAHVGSCNYYPYKLCCYVENSELRFECQKNESAILSLLDYYNSHVATSNYSLYPLKVCVNYMECFVKSVCESYEHCAFSIAKLNNAHVGSCNYYPYKVCCVKTTIFLHFFEPKNGSSFYRGETINFTIYANDSLSNPIDFLEINLTFYLSNGSSFVLKANNVGNGYYIANYTVKNIDSIGYWTVEAKSYKKYYRIEPSNVTIKILSHVNVTLLSPTQDQLYYGFTPGEKADFEVLVTDENNETVEDGNVEIILESETQKIILEFNSTSGKYEKHDYIMNLSLGEHRLIINFTAPFRENVIIYKNFWMDKAKIKYNVSKYRYYRGENVAINGRIISELREIGIPSLVNITLQKGGKVIRYEELYTDKEGYFSTEFYLPYTLTQGVYYIVIYSKGPV